MTLLILSILLSNLIPTWVAYLDGTRATRIPAILLWVLGVVVLILCLVWPNGAWLTSNPWLHQRIADIALMPEQTAIPPSATQLSSLPAGVFRAPTAVEVLHEDLWLLWLIGCWLPIFVAQLIGLGLGTLRDELERRFAEGRQRRKRKFTTL